MHPVIAVEAAVVQVVKGAGGEKPWPAPIEADRVQLVAEVRLGIIEQALDLHQGQHRRVHRHQERNRHNPEREQQRCGQ